jgi:hypothetical protein
MRYHISLIIRCTRILEGKFREKIFMHLWTIRPRGILYNIFKEESASFGPENVVNVL